MTLRRAELMSSIALLGAVVAVGCAPGEATEVSSRPVDVTTDAGASTSTTEVLGAGTTTSASTLPPAPGDGLAATRPYRVVLPADMPSDAQLPVVVLLHGYSGTAELIAAEVGLLSEADRRGAVVVLPDGVPDRVGNQFWNATDACCDFWGAAQDDSAYLAAVIRAVQADRPVDPQRVAVIGHSNGGFMAYRMACDHADLVTAVASLAGAMHLDTNDCSPSRPVRVLQIHGTLDEVVRYDGGRLLGGPPHPGAVDSVRMWAMLNGCSGRDPVVRDGRLDIDGSVDGAEAALASIDGCPDRGTVGVVTVERGGHFPWGGTDLVPTLFDVLLEPSAP